MALSSWNAPRTYRGFLKFSPCLCQFYLVYSGSEHSFFFKDVLLDAVHGTRSEPNEPFIVLKMTSGLVSLRSFLPDRMT